METSEEILKLIQEAELKKIYDWFLPKQRAFADKWGLVVNVD